MGIGAERETPKIRHNEQPDGRLGQAIGLSFFNE
jgi:hypothetical protein